MEVNQKEKIINILGMIVISFTIIMFNLIIGANEKTLPLLPICVILGLIIIVLLTKKIVLKANIVLKSKTDLAVLLFMVSLCLPFLFKTYCTYQGTIEFIIKYFFAYSVYLLVRNVVDTQKKINILISLTIFSSLIIIILGLDIMNRNIFENLIKALNLYYKKTDKFSSTFGYANTVAIYLLFCVFLALNRIENAKKIASKIIYYLYIALASYIIFITLSRVVLILYISSVLIYLFAKNYYKIKNNKKLIFKIVIGIIIFITGFSVYIYIGSQYSRPVLLETDKKIKKQFNPYEKYNIKVELEVQNIDEEKTELQIVQVNEYFQETVLVNKDLNTNQHIQEMEFTPTKSVYYIKIKVVNKGDKKIVIHKCYVNDEEYVFKSKYIPLPLYKFITTLSIKDESILQRTQYWKVCLKIAKDHLIIGQGGNTWKKLFYVYQEYPYNVKESHSYFFELLISYGIIGLIAFFAIIIAIYTKTIDEVVKDKKNRKQKLFILIGLGLLLLHSITFDFNMSFIVILLTFFEYIAILQVGNNRDIEESEKLKNLLDFAMIIFLILIFVILIKVNISIYNVSYRNEKNACIYIAEYNLDYIIERKERKKEFLNDLKELMIKEPFYKQDYIHILYWNEVTKNIEKKETEEYVKFGIDNFKKIKCEKTMNYNSCLNRVKIMSDIYKKLKKANNEYTKKYAIELKEIIIKEYKENLANLIDNERYQIDEDLRKNVIESYESYMEILNETY